MTHPLFTPTDVPGARLDELTVGREDVLDRLTRRIKDIAITRARPHSLIVGPRGSGKTHLLTLALYRANLDPEVAANLTVAHIAEDAIGIGSYPDLLVELIRAVSPADAQSALALRRQKQTVELEQLLLAAAHGHSLLLVLENLDRIFQAIGEKGQRALRGLVETSAQIALLASTPVLSHALATRTEPWFGSFDVEYLADLSLADGSHLLRQLAVERGEDNLAAFLDQQQGQDRLAALAHLAGGSPRLWHVLSGCLTVDTLDELIPAVRALLEQLTPYYQQRLWELPATEQQLVVTLARTDGAVTVSSLAEESGVERATTATTLLRLADAGWVRSAKWPGTDQRTTWYELREPLLRHHLQYREARGGTLDLIVTILRAWYTTSQRMKMLGAPTLGEHAEKYLAQSMADHTSSPFRRAYRDRSIEQLRAEVRRWKQSVGDELVGSAVLANAIGDICSHIGTLPYEDTRNQAVATQVGAELHRLLRRTWSTDDLAVLSLMEVRWNCATDSVRAHREIAGLLALRGDQADRLTVLIAFELAELTGLAGDPSDACRQLASLIEKKTKVSGADHPDILSARGNLARWRGVAGDAAAAVAGFEAVVVEMTRVLGADHRDTLAARHNLALWRGKAGDAAAAVAGFEAVVVEMTRVLGADHRDTLAARHNLARWRGKAGDAAAAVAGFEAVVVEMTRVLGADHPDTLESRQHLAYWRGVAGDAAAAVAGFEAVVVEMTRVLGADHPDTLESRHHLAYWRGVAGDAAAAVAGFEAMAADRSRVLGADHPDTLESRHHLAYWRGKAGDAAAAVAGFEAMAAEMTRVLGPDHRDTLESRHHLAYWRGKAGDAAAAVAGFEAMAADRSRVLGPDHRDTLAARHNLAYWRGKAGDAAAAVAGFEAVAADRSRVLGADHRDTLESRHHLAYWRGEAGDAAAAVAGFEAVAADMSRVLGQDHPDTLQARHNLRYWRRATAAVNAILDDARHVRIKKIPALVAHLDPDRKEAAATAIITSLGFASKWRTKVLEAAELADDALGWRIHRALDGDGMALAGLPEEIRSLVAVRRL